MPYILGIDEAGRGCVIGPLIVAGVLLDERREFLLKKIGVKDSKKLSHGKRVRLAKRIKKIAKDVVTVVIDVEEINEEMKTKKLNQIEAERIARIINTLSSIYKIDKIYIDSLEKNCRKFTEKLKAFLSEKAKGIEIIAENRADEKYPAVSAASILAKVKREEIIGRLKKEYGDFGSGYSSDEKTIKFLKEKGSKVKEILRNEWYTLERLKIKDRKLDEF